MSDEITIKFAVNIANGTFIESFGSQANLAFTQNNQGSHKPTIVVNPSDELINFGDVVTPGLLFMKNLDSEIAVNFGPSVTGGGVTMVPFGTIEPGEIVAMRMHPSGDLMMSTPSGSVLVQMLLLED